MWEGFWEERVCGVDNHLNWESKSESEDGLWKCIDPGDARVTLRADDEYRLLGQTG